MSFPETFSTARLTAARLTAEHLPELIRMHRDADVMQHLGGLRDRAQTEDYLARNLRHWEEYGFGLWILHETAAGNPVGRAVLRHARIEGTDEVEVGYGFYRPFWGRGLASEITAACLNHARDDLGLYEIVAITTRPNIASQHVLQKAGLRFDREFLYEGGPALLFRRPLR